MRMSAGRRVPSLVAAAAAAVAAVVLTLALALPGPRVPGPRYAQLTGELVGVWQDRLREDALVGERLGGLSTVVPSDDPVLAACADPDRPVPAPAGADQVDTVVAQVEALRGLESTEPVTIRLLDDTEMTAEVAGFLERRWDGERIALDHRVLTTLGAVGPGTDLAKLRVDAYADQVSGFFRGSDGIAVRTGDAPALTPLERVVLAHEVEHALTFQNLGRPASRTADAARAASAVLEGSAVLAMRMYARTVLSGAERARVRADLLVRAQADPLAGFGPYLRAELRFPYRDGLRYVCQRWLEGGWEAVDAAFSDPPLTTAGVLFPDRHDDLPRRPAALGDPGEQWVRARAGDFGAAELMWLLAAPGGDESAAVGDPRQRAGAWDGGELVVWTRGGQTALGLALVDRGTGPSLCDSVRAWYAAAYPDATRTGDGRRTSYRDGAQQAVLSCDGDQVRLGIAPTGTGASAIAR
jgi:hypothetical protein